MDTVSSLPMEYGNKHKQQLERQQIEFPKIWILRHKQIVDVALVRKQVVHPTTAVVLNEKRAKYMIMLQEETKFHRISQIMTITY